jgi:hypothetical protein
LIQLFKNEDWNNDGTKYQEFQQKVIDLIPKLGSDGLIELAMFLSFEAKLNDK